jgi:hypothetical protein
LPAFLLGNPKEAELKTGCGSKGLKNLRRQHPHQTPSWQAVWSREKKTRSEPLLATKSQEGDGFAVP